MAYQGVLAYFYDVLYPNRHVELDVCRWNQVVADVIWRGPNGKEHMHQCRDYPAPGIEPEQNTPENGQCYDCRTLPVDQTITAHFTACKKPWECTVPKPRIPRDKRQVYRLQHLTNATTCGLLFAKYFEYRLDIEQRIARVIGGSSMASDTASGGYFPEYFRGFCDGAGRYRTMNTLPDDFDMKRVYGF